MATILYEGGAANGRVARGIKRRSTSQSRRGSDPRRDFTLFCKFRVTAPRLLTRIPASKKKKPHGRRSGRAAFDRGRTVEPDDPDAPRGVS
ncbi:hypothetical protein [Burkholderia cenocepacia]|uniref:hypothetical protein n=1 Tax=Burkholderia cenocepacia TaxID=95486 RepID=UPI0028675E86|nr:hypothetical protein [Burkholderia cenocepacia]MDR8069371.1 hypothetical protein [Burkholderia cenocepacia]